MRRTASGSATTTTGSGTTGASSATTPTTAQPTSTPTASPSATTPTPPAPAPGPTTRIAQVIRIPVASVQAFNVPATKLLYERGYGHSIGIFDTANNRYHAGCSVDGTASARRQISVSFVATVSEARAANAQTQSTALVNNPGALVTGMNAAKAAAVAAGDNQFAGVTIPNATAITAEAPSVTVISSGCDSLAASWVIGVGLAFVAMRH